METDEFKSFAASVIVGYLNVCHPNDPDWVEKTEDEVVCSRFQIEGNQMWGLFYLLTEVEGQPDIYYEVTYDKSKEEMQLTFYKKFYNIVLGVTE